MAANLAAFYSGGGPLPGDASSVQADAIKKPRPWGLILGGGLIVLVMFGVGYGCGNISVGRTAYNETTDQAAKVRDEIVKIQKTVAEVAATLREIKLSDKEPPNFAAITKLRDIDFKEPDITRNLFRTNYASFEPQVVQELFHYYNDVIVLHKQITEHSAKTLKDQEAIEKYVKANAAKSDKVLGIILDFSQQLPQSQLVELGGLVCPQPGQTDCPPAEAKFRFRTSVGGDFQVRPLKGKPEASVFPMAPTELQKQVLSGDPNMLAFKDYIRRTAAIIDTLKKLSEGEKQLVGNLKQRAEKPKLFTL